MHRYDEDPQYENTDFDATHFDTSKQAESSPYLPPAQVAGRAYHLPEMDETKSLDIPPPANPYEIADEETLGLDPATRSLGHALGLTKLEGSSQASGMELADAWARPASSQHAARIPSPSPAFPSMNSPQSPPPSASSALSEMELADAWARPPVRHETHAYGDAQGQHLADEPVISTFKDSRKRAAFDSDLAASPASSSSSVSLAVQMRGEEVGLGGGFRLALGSILFVLALAIVGLTAMIFRELQKEPPPPPRPRVDPAAIAKQQKKEDEAMHQRRYLLAVDAARQGRWDIALRSFRVVAQHSEDPARKRRAQAIQAYAERELTAKSTLDAARSAFNGSRYSEAFHKIATIPPDTQVKAQVARLRKQIRAAAFNKNLKRLSRLRKRKRFSPAKKLLATALALDPSYMAIRREHALLARALKRPAAKCRSACKRRHRGKARQERRLRCLQSCESSYKLSPLPPIPPHQGELSGMARFGKALLKEPSLSVPEIPPAHVPTAPLPTIPSTEKKAEPSDPSAPPNASPTPVQAALSPSCAHKCRRARNRRLRRRCTSRCIALCKRRCRIAFNKQKRICPRKCRRNRRCKRSCHRSAVAARKKCYRNCR